MAIGGKRSLQVLGTGPSLVITAATMRTSVGTTAVTTTAAVRAGISRCEYSEEFDDSEGNPIMESRLSWPEDDADDAEEPYAPTWSDDDDDDDEIQDDDDEPEDDDEPAQRVARAAKECLGHLVAAIALNPTRPCHLLLGLAPRMRPGPRYEGDERRPAAALVDLLRQHFKSVTLHLEATGNASGLAAVELAARLLTHDPHAFCIVGSVDSLLAPETLAYFEGQERLRSETLGRNHGFAPAEAVVFLALEHRDMVRRERRAALAEVAGTAVAVEPAPFVSDQPGLGAGLGAAYRAACAHAGCPPDAISLVVCDLNGEFHRAKEWSMIDVRCTGAPHPQRLLWHPAESFGCIGAASGSVGLGIAAVALSRGWACGDRALVFASDDWGVCGCTILSKFSN